MQTNQIRVWGHSLPLEGLTFDPDTQTYRNGYGSARCTCGVVSPVLPSTTARREWGREHKKEMLENGAEIRPSIISLTHRPMNDQITKLCPISGQPVPEASSPDFDRAHTHVECPKCHRTLYARESGVYPAHYVHVTPGRDDEIAKTRIKMIPGLYVEGRGRGWRKEDGEAVGKRKWPVHRLTYGDRSYLLWRVSEEHMWSISPYNPFEEVHLAVADELDTARGIVVDWGAGGSIYEDPKFREMLARV